MIEKITNINLAKSNPIPTMINSSLPIIIKVLQKTRYDRYNIKFGTKTVSTKSLKELEIDSEYFANIGSQSAGMININSLIKRDEIKPVLQDGVELIQNIINSKDLLWLKPYIKNKMANTDSKDEFSIYSDMIMALNENIIHIPFFYNSRSALMQISLNAKMQIYLLFSIFAPVIISLRDGQIDIVKTPYPNLGKALADELKCQYQTQATAPLWQKTTIKAKI